MLYLETTISKLILNQLIKFNKCTLSMAQWKNKRKVLKIWHKFGYTQINKSPRKFNKKSNKKAIWTILKCWARRGKRKIERERTGREWTIRRRARKWSKQSEWCKIDDKLNHMDFGRWKQHNLNETQKFSTRVNKANEKREIVWVYQQNTWKRFGISVETPRNTIKICREIAWNSFNKLPSTEKNTRILSKIIKNLRFVQQQQHHNHHRHHPKAYRQL